MKCIDLIEKRKWKKLELLRKPRDLKCKRELRLNNLREKRRLKNIDSSKNVLDLSMKLDKRPKEKRERLKLKLTNLSNREELKSINSSKS